MAWERILKTQKVFVLREQRDGPLDVIADIVGVFSSEEALNKWLINEHGNRNFKYYTHRKKMTDKELLEEIFLTYDYLIDEAEMKG